MKNQNLWPEIIGLSESAESKLAKARLKAFRAQGLNRTPNQHFVIA